MDVRMAAVCRLFLYRARENETRFVHRPNGTRPPVSVRGAVLYGFSVHGDRP